MDDKALFDIPPGGLYLLAHSAGCLPKNAPAALETGLLAPWRAQGGHAWDAWLGEVAGFNAALAALLGGEAQDWCPQPSVSAALFALLSGARFDAGRRTVLVSRHAFPTIGFAAGGLERMGLVLELIEGEPSDLASWGRVRDKDVAAVVLMHVHSNTGRLSPIAEVAALARAHGVMSVVDIAQSAGVLPIDVTAWRVDGVVGSSLKWLCGGPGAGYLWAAPETSARAAPPLRGWWSHENPFEMDVGHFAYASRAARYWGGTPSVAPYVLAGNAIRQIAAIGVETIRAHNLALMRQLVAAAPQAFVDGFEPARGGGTLCLVAGADIDARLTAKGVHFDRRGDVIRLSFAIWNDETDVAEVASCL